jgi:putative PEP-CTERM system integral membrane protein
MKPWLDTLVYAIFWLWNLTFLTFVYIGILPFIAPFLLLAAVSGELPIDFSFSLIALIVVPTACTWIGLVNLKNNPVQLFRLFYGVEAPLFLLCLLRLFLIRELTPASTQIIVSISLCILAFLGELLHGYANQKKSIASLQLAAHSLMLLVGVYTGILLLFYAVPLTAWLLRGLVTLRWLPLFIQSFEYGGVISFIWWAFLFLLLVGISATVFVGMPAAMTGLYLQSGRRVWRSFASQYGRNRAMAGTIGVTVASLVLFLAFQQQPQVQAFQVLDRPAMTGSDKQALLAKSDLVRSGLVNAYLSNYRYLSSEAANDHIKRMYSNLFGLPDAITQSLQATYNSLMSPFLYKGSSADVEKAEKLYEQFFDTAIQKAEREAVNNALRSTYNQDEAKAGLLNFNQQKVWLKSQQVTVQEQGDWASVELHEVYENQTFEQQEVFYSFSLPESAVITGLWLGDTGDRRQRFPYVVSPRGAAQQVYTQQVQQRVDPALLEQVGPRHYRLRAFPVPPKGGTLSNTNNPTQMHLWLTYHVMRQNAGWALPDLGEKRNLYWSIWTERIRNGNKIKALDGWLEPFLAVAQDSQPIAHQVTFPEGRLTAKPLTPQDYVLPQNQRFAVVVDTSRSMGKHQTEFTHTIDWLKQQGFANNQFTDNDADLFLTAATGATPTRLDDLSQFNPKQITFYGTVQLQQMLQQFIQLRGDTRYDGVLLLTDEGSYELSNDGATDGAAATNPSPSLRRDLDRPAPTSTSITKRKPVLPKMPAPLWMVHLGALPPAYDDETLKAIDTSGGGVSTQLSDGLYRMATKAKLGSAIVNVVDGYAWKLDKSTNPSQPASQPDPFAALAARQLILGLSRSQDVNQLVNLDAIHTIAKRFSIVTPYSSMIVLVNDAQREALRKAEEQADRFDREVESGKEQLTKPANPLSQEAVPEPSMVVGLSVGAIGLWLFKRQRHKLRFK